MGIPADMSIPIGSPDIFVGALAGAGFFDFDVSVIPGMPAIPGIVAGFFTGFCCASKAAGTAQANTRKSNGCRPCSRSINAPTPKIEVKAIPLVYPDSSRFILIHQRSNLFQLDSPRLAWND
jgi:hypothetical protein